MISLVKAVLEVADGVECLCLYPSDKCEMLIVEFHLFHPGIQRITLRKRIQAQIMLHNAITYLMVLSATILNQKVICPSDFLVRIYRIEPVLSPSGVK